MIVRKLGKVLRGKATPFQVFSACLLGSLLGFAPGFQQAPGLLATWLLLLLLLNANLGLALLVFVPARLLSLVAMPVAFQLGRLLLDGPTGGLFRGLINAPVLAWFGFEYYTVSGGVVLGLACGLASGLLVVRTLAATRRKLASLEQGSERYRVWTAKPWVKLLLFVFAGGGKGKKSYEELLQRKVGNPVRIAGAVVAVAVVAGVWLLQGFLGAPVLRSTLRSQLESANGATVDVGAVDLDLEAGRLRIAGLAAADPNALERDLFRAAALEADVSTADLLRKRVTIDRLVVSDALYGGPREVPGELVGPPPTPSEPESDGGGLGDVTLEDVLEQYDVWRERLAQAREWIDRVGTSGEEGAAAGEGTPAGESLRERLAREVREKGWTRVAADHLIEGAPTLLVSELVVDGLRSQGLDEVYDLSAHNLSTQPALVQGAPTLSLTSRSGDMELALGLDASSADPDQNKLLLRWDGLSVDRVAGGLRIDGQRPVSGGTMDLSIDGRWRAGALGRVDLPLQVTLHDTRLALPGVGEQQVERLALPIGLRGPIDAPRIHLDQGALKDALVQAGADRLVGELEGEANKALEEARQKAKDAVGEQLEEQAGGLLDDVLKKGGKDGKSAGGALEGLFGGKKKD